MKKLNFILAGIAAFGMVSCSDDDNSSSNNNGNDANLTEIRDAVRAGTWKISNYEDNGVNETADYSGYNFTFGPNNILTASNGTNTYTGTWSVTNDDSSSDDDNNSGNDVDFDISFNSPAILAEISDDWDIAGFNESSLMLIDVSGGNGGTDRLAFQKN
ncbi:MAG: hypothetical protein EOO45_09150 [Flavobacterium sp.]|nr:MAG: hypothetical protein EOO45_09150 [Flavobacterium sp.]